MEFDGSNAGTWYENTACTGHGIMFNVENAVGSWGAYYTGSEGCAVDNFGYEQSSFTVQCTDAPGDGIDCADIFCGQTCGPNWINNDAQNNFFCIIARDNVDLREQLEEITNNHGEITEINFNWY